MAMDGWYLNIKTKYEVDKNDLNIIYCEQTNDVFSLTISYSYLSFFEGIKHIYNWIMENYNSILECETNNIIIDFSSDFQSFFNKMYEINKKKLDWFHNQFGLLLIVPGEDTYSFIKKNKKLLSKHYSE